MSKSKEKEELEKYIFKEGLTDTYALLRYQIQLCEAKFHLIRESLKVLIESNISSSTTDTIIKIQTSQLDLISKLGEHFFLHWKIT